MPRAHNSFLVFTKSLPSSQLEQIIDVDPFGGASLLTEHRRKRMNEDELPSLLGPHDQKILPFPRINTVFTP